MASFARTFLLASRPSSFPYGVLTGLHIERAFCVSACVHALTFLFLLCVAEDVVEAWQ